MSDRFRVGAIRDLYTHPLYRILKSSPAHPGELLFDTPAAHVDRILSNECDAAFVAPMDYAINSSDLEIIPGVGVLSSGFSGIIRLYFRSELKTIRSMAVGPVTTTDVVLSRIVLNEKYDSAPVIVPVAGSVDEMLAKADCALVSGGALLRTEADHPFLDVVDEWTDITDLPFVHTLCVARSGSTKKGIGDFLIASAQAGRLELQGVADELSRDRALSPEYLLEFLSHLSYDFNDTAKESLETFMQMAFLLGLIGDVPDIILSGGF
ncbi:MAG: MqnA/MqnD/SBP family protein [Bacteroidota bacterium]